MKFLVCACLVLLSGTASAGQVISTGQVITPEAASGAMFGPLNPRIPERPGYVVGQAEAALASPDGRTLLVLTSGYNLNWLPSGAEDPLTSTEFVFVFDISHGRPVQLQALPVPNSFSGMAWAPDGTHFFVGGGQNDNVHVFAKAGSGFAEAGAPIPLNDTAYGVPMPAGLGLYARLGMKPATTPLNGGMAVTADGATLVVAELENDQLSLVDLKTRTVTHQALRPGNLDAAKKGVAGGEFPYWVALTRGGTAYVSSERDREIDVVDLSKHAVTARIPVAGNPNRLVLNKAQTRLFATADNSDMFYVIDTARNAVIGQVRTTAPAGTIASGPTNGASPNSLVLSPDDHTAYVTNAAMNDVAVIDISGPSPVVRGLIPTGWEPTSVATSADGTMLYVVNAASVTGPNPQFKAIKSNFYDWALSKAGFLSMPAPSQAQLDRLTKIVAENNHFGASVGAKDAETMRFLHAHIRHVIYIVKENRTYDQILGDLGIGDGDASLAMYGQAFTPNFHALSKQFVDLDNYYDPALSSMDGWQFSTAGRVQDLNRKVTAVNYGKGGGSYDSEGTSRDVNVGLPTADLREKALKLYGAQAASDPDLLPGASNEVAPDGPDGEREAGYIWDAVLRAHVPFRNYGFLVDLEPYFLPAAMGGLPPLRDPASTHTVVAVPAVPSLMGRTDPYFRGFDTKLPDFYRFKEWAREFDQFVANGKLPGFETVRFMMDHTGSFATAIDGVNTPEIQEADNDYAVGLLIDRIAHSRYAADTLVFVTEDDSQDGPDHVDTHRSTGYVVGPYVKHGAVVSTRYSTLNMLRTMSDILGLETLDVQLADAGPMTEVFDTSQAGWTYTAKPARVLLTNTQLPIDNKQELLKHASLQGAPVRLRHDASWWAAATKGFDFSREDLNDEAKFNRVLWRGTMGDVAYPRVVHEAP
jgi:DNA-binding beta-propeller fold protein YncE